MSSESALIDRARSRGLHDRTATFVHRTHPLTLRAWVSGAAVVPDTERRGRRHVDPRPPSGFRAKFWTDGRCRLCGAPTAPGQRLVAVADSGPAADRYAHALCARAKRAADGERRDADAEAARLRRDRRRAGRRRS